MKLTKAVLRQFEDDQANFSTEVALSNFVWGWAAELLASIGVTRIKTTYRKTTK